MGQGIKHSLGVHISPCISGELGNNLGAKLMPLVLTCGFVQRGQNGSTKKCYVLAGKQSTFQVGSMSRAAQDLLQCSLYLGNIKPNLSTSHVMPSGSCAY